jgi:asparagine synthase (glutamine-hydrolysing)
MDIASMHCGLETRSPLLDHQLIEFCASLPVQYKVKHSVNKYLLKKLATRYYPASFVHRPKQGFAVPLANWLRGPLSGTLNETLRDSQLMAPLSRPVIERTLRQFDKGEDRHQHRLWALLMFGCWRKMHAEAA